MEKVILIGGGGHARQVIEIIKACGSYHIVGITDNDPLKRKRRIDGVPVVGNDEALHHYFKKGVRQAFISLGSVDDTKARINLYKMLIEIGFELINVIHASALVSASVTLGTGNAIMPGSIINAHTTLGSNCIINTGAIVEHDCSIEDHVHIATGAKVAGGVTIQEGSHIGLGALIKQGITIGKYAIVGAGALVLDDVPDKVVCGGIPAKILKHLRDTLLH
jgi:UDP-perosamine 4-acetyltransferase